MEHTEEQYEQIRKELEDFQREKERIRKMIGSIGGQKYSHRDNIINIIFLVVIITLFMLEVTAKILPPMISIELSVFLVSIKIVFMMHQQHRYNHFVFWILNSIEFRVNQASGTISRIEQQMRADEQNA